MFIRNAVIVSLLGIFGTQVRPLPPIRAPMLIHFAHMIKADYGKAILE
jgi:hypothetical protein